MKEAGSGVPNEGSGNSTKGTQAESQCGGRDVNYSAGVLCLSALSHDELSARRATRARGGTRARTVTGEVGISGGLGAVASSAPRVPGLVRQ
jgi:hypothetical protein